ncbi:MAG: polysaccharide biosynthesis C-terminal domain-containing protein [Methanobacterium sp.]|jgi:O-antigen/teichoic acid export membrane protein
MDNKFKNQGYSKFSRDIFWLSLSQILLALFGIITLPALTKTYGAELYGLWSQIFITVNLLYPILTLYFGSAIIRYLSGENDKKVTSQEIAGTLFTILIFIILLILFSIIFSKELSIFLFKSYGFASFIPLMVIWAGANALYYHLISYMRIQGRIKFLSMLNLACSGLQLSLLVILALLKYPLSIIVISQILIEIIFVLLVYILVFREIGFSLPNFRNIPKYLSFSLPQIPGSVLMWILNYSDRYFIIYYLNLVEVGIYSVSYGLGSLITLFYAPISFVIYPVISKCWNNGEFEEVNRYLEYSTKIFLAFSIPASLGLYVLATPLLKILTTSQFVVGGELVLLVALGTIFLGLFQINIYIILLVQQTRWIPLITGLSSVINILLNIILIPKTGITGAAIATLISYFILAVIVSYWARKEVSYHIDLKFLLKVIIASIIMSIFINILLIILVKSVILKILLSVLMGSIIYFTLLFIFRAFTESEKKFIHSTYNDLKINLF